MKSCPVCKARCFDDMEVCYGCMHRFGTGDGTYGFGRKREDAAADAGGSVTLSLPKVPRHIAGERAMAVEGRVVAVDGDAVQRKARHALVPVGPAGPPYEAEGFQAEYQLFISLKPRS